MTDVEHIIAGRRPLMKCCAAQSDDHITNTCRIVFSFATFITAALYLGNIQSRYLLNPDRTFTRYEPALIKIATEKIEKCFYIIIYKNLIVILILLQLYNSRLVSGKYSISVFVKPRSNIYQIRTGSNKNCNRKNK